MWIVSMRMTSSKPRAELAALSKEGFAKFEALPGLISKHYITNHETGEGGGVYLFETQEAAENYVNGPIVATVGERFGVDGDVKVELVEVIHVLEGPARAPAAVSQLA